MVLYNRKGEQHLDMTDVDISEQVYQDMFKHPKLQWCPKEELPVRREHAIKKDVLNANLYLDEWHFKR